jgi:CrcB protein
VAPSIGVAVVALGGALGALARWAAGQAVPDGHGFPATTLVVNVVGSFLLAALPAVAAVRRRPRLTLFLGTGLLGGFTTFSTYAEQSRSLVATGSPGLAAAYVVGTLAACLLAAVAGRALTTATGRRTVAAEEGDR